MSEHWINFVSGGLASITAEVCTLPMDTVKIHLQTQNFKTLVPMIRREGISFLYRGLVPGIYRQAIYSGIKMGMYNHVKGFVTHRTAPADPTHPKLIHRILSGGISGVLGSAFTNPFDILKIRRQAQKEVIKKNLFRDLYNLGLRGLHQGLSINLQRSFVINAAELAAYDTSKTYFLENRDWEDNITTHFVSSCCAGFFAAGAAAPVDFTKTRLMNDTKSQYKGIIDCFVQTVRKEGFLRLYSGFLPAWLRIGPWCCIMFVTWEKYSKWLSKDII